MSTGTIPNTRASLIVRLSNPGDIEAWQQFVEIYLPLLYRLARRKGLQHVDAEELAQEVLLAVSRAVHRWDPDPQRGRFRDWLFRIARNLILNFLTRNKNHGVCLGDTDIRQLLDQQVHVDAQQSALFRTEYRHELFRWAAEKVRATVTTTTWDAFWKTAVDSRPVAEVALELNINIGAVYIARSRVMAKLRKLATKCRDQDTPRDGSRIQESSR
jgi:RNA polymerase sigma factor (sigma-70 family)